MTIPTTSTTTPPLAAQGQPMLAVAGRTIVIDPGHNGANSSHPAEIGALVDAGGFRKACDTTGTSTNSGYAEATYTFTIARDLAAALTSAGAHVVLTRSDNVGWGPCVDRRAAIGNAADADVAISIHADGGPPGGVGFHVLYPPAGGWAAAIAGESLRLAHDIRRTYQAGTGEPPANYVGVDGLDPRADLGGLNLSKVPKVFIECGNMRNSTDAVRLADPAFQQRVAGALAAGLDAYLAGR